MHVFQTENALLPVSNMAHLAVDLKETEGQRTSLPRTVPGVQSQVFAGRLGGNQQFAVSSSDPDYHEIVAKEPDAGRESSWKALLDLHGFYDPDLWRLAIIEGIGTMLQTFISGLLGAGLTPTVTETSVGPVFTVALAAITNIFVITLFIYTAGPITGAHFNPLITMATFFTRLSSLPRTVLYILFQCIGAVVGAFLVRASLGASAKDLAVVPGCYIDTSIVTPGEE
jgi:Major intrinsic protein